jgi:heme/copper-type cytochrome/quinol oxidase subunit 3
MNQTVLEQNLSRDELIALKNRRTGMTVFQISWIMVFVCLIVVNLSMRGNFPSWPPPGIDPLDRVLPTLATIGLIISGVLARRAVQAVQQNHKETFLAQWRITLLMGIGFVLIMAYEWLSVGVSGQYGLVFRLMTAFHAIHALVIAYVMFRVQQSVQHDAYGTTFEPLRFWPVDGALKLWYFVVIAWLMFYVVLYII